MSFFGASSSVGGGGFRFNAPSNSRGYGSSLASSSSSAVMTGGVTLSTAPDAPPLTMQILQKSTRPKLQMLFSQVNSCRSRAATVVKGSTSQKQFNAQYTSLIPLLGSAIKDLDEELFFVVEAQNMAAAASSASGGGGGVEKLDPKKIPTSVTIHSVTRDLAVFVTSIKGCSLNVPYLDLISKAAIAAVIEKETAHEKANAAKNAKEALKKEKERAAAAIAAASTSATPAIGGSALSSSGTTSALPNSILVGGLPSPLQKPLTAALQEHNSNSSNVNANVSGGGIALFPSAASASAVGGGASSASGSGGSVGVGGGLPALLQENRALLQAVQPWLIPYPFSHGVKTERVQSTKTSHAKTLRIGFAVNTFLKKHPELAATILEKVPPNILQQYARTAQPPNFSNPPHTAYNNPHNNNTISMNTTAAHGAGGMSPSLAPSNANTNTANAVEIAASLPAELLLQYILSYSGFSRADFYSLAPKILEICACPTANEMLTKWEQREAVFDILLNAPSVGAENLGQPSSINHQNQQQQQPADDQQKSPNDEEDAANTVTGPSSCPQLSLAMRTAQLSSVDNNELFLGSPNLKPCGGAASGGLAPAAKNASGSAAIGVMTPLMLGGNGYDQDEGEDGDTLAPLILEKAYEEDDNQNDSNSSERLKEYGFPNNSNNNSSNGTTTALSAPPPASKRIGGGRGFFPHRCSNPALLDKAAFITNSSGNNQTTAGYHSGSEPLSQQHGGGRPSHSNVNGASSSMYSSHSYAAAGKKRGREADDGSNPRASGGGGLGMFDVSPLLSGSDPLLGDANDLFLGIGASPPGTPQPPGGGKATRYSGGSEGHRGGGARGGHPHTEHPHSLPPPPASTAPTAININTTIPSDPSLIEPQPLLSVSDRVMACLLHFGVVTTEMPMLAAEAIVAGAVIAGTVPQARKETAKVR